MSIYILLLLEQPGYAVIGAYVVNQYQSAEDPCGQGMTQAKKHPDS